MFDELKEKIPQLINLGYTGMLLELSNACLRLKCKQALFFKVIIFFITKIKFYDDLKIFVNFFQDIM